MTCNNCCVLLDDKLLELKVLNGIKPVHNDYYIVCPVCDDPIDLREWDIPIPSDQTTLDK